ncbi:glycosyltransferase family 4 protein [Sphingomonas oryzagri]
MRILLSIHHRLDRDSGAAGVIMRLVEQFVASGHEVRIVSFDDLPMLPRLVRRLLFPFALSRSARRWQPDIIDASSGDAWWCFRSMAGHRPVRITHSHGLEHLASRAEIEQAQRRRRWRSPVKLLLRDGLRLRLVARSFRAADRCFVLNESEADFLSAELGIDRSRIHRVRLGSDHAGYHLPSLFLGEPRRIVQIGSFIERKGIRHSVPAMIEVLRLRPRSQMLFIGTGAPRGEVLCHFPAELHDRVRVIPSYVNSALPQLIDGAALCLMPSLFEGYGIAKIEAMACGVVPITSDDPGSATDIEDGEDGLVFPRGNSAALRDAVLALLDAPERRDAMARRAREKAAGFSWERAASDRIALYEQAREELRGGLAPVA